MTFSGEEKGYTGNKWVNLDPTKQALEVIFPCKSKQPTHPLLKFNGFLANLTNSQKHLECLLDSKLNFEKHLQNTCNKKLPKQLLLYSNFKIFYLDFPYLALNSIMGILFFISHVIKLSTKSLNYSVQCMSSDYWRNYGNNFLRKALPSISVDIYLL